MNFNVVLLVVFTVATVNFHGAYSRRDACQYEREDFPAQKPVVIPPPIVGVDDIPISALNDATKTPKLGSTRYHSQDDKRYCSSSYYDPVRGYLPEIRTDYHQRDNTGAPQLPTTRRPKKIPQKKRKPSRTFPKPSLKDKFLKKLCSFKFVRFDNDTIEEYKEENCKLDTCQQFIPENNIPFSFDVDGKTGNIFVAIPRNFKGVPSTLNVFNVKDIRKGICPRLTPYPNYDLNALDTDCCGDPLRITNVFRIKIDTCKKPRRLFFVDVGILTYKDKDLEVKGPYLYAVDIDKHEVILQKPIPLELIDKKSRGLYSLSIDVRNKDCTDTYVYITDRHNGKIVVYSQYMDRFFSFKSPYFYADGAEGEKVVYSPVTGNLLTYFIHGHVSESTIDRKNKKFYTFAHNSRHVSTVPLENLNNIELSGCSPNKLNATLVGDLPPFFNGHGVTLYDPKEVFFGIAEQRYEIYCFSDTTGPEKAIPVIENYKLLPYPVDIQGEAIDLLKFNIGRGRDEGLDKVFILSNNLESIFQEGFKKKFPNFIFSYFEVDKVLGKFKECNLKTLFRDSYYNRRRYEYQIGESKLQRKVGDAVIPDYEFVESERNGSEIPPTNSSTEQENPANDNLEQESSSSENSETNDQSVETLAVPEKDLLGTKNEQGAPGNQSNINTNVQSGGVPGLPGIDELPKTIESLLPGGNENEDTDAIDQEASPPENLEDDLPEASAGLSLVEELADTVKELIAGKDQVVSGSDEELPFKENNDQEDASGIQKLVQPGGLLGDSLKNDDKAEEESKVQEVKQIINGTRLRDWGQ